MTAVLMLAILLTGLVGTSQLILHYSDSVASSQVDEIDESAVESAEIRTIQPIDIYGGYLIGFVAMAIAIFFMLG
jgi:hypothetical protein